MGKRLAGTCYFKVDGEQLELQGDLEFPFNSVTRETMASTTGVVGFKETVTVPYVAGTFIVPESFPRQQADGVNGDDDYSRVRERHGLHAFGGIHGGRHSI